MRMPTPQAYGAAGGTAGTLAGAATALIFILFVFVTFRRRFLRKVRRDRTKVKEAFGTMMKVLILTTIPVLLSTTIYNISSIIDNGIFKNIAHLQGYDATQISEWWGVFTGQYKVLINVPVSIASAMSASCVPSLTAAFHAGEKRACGPRSIPPPGLSWSSRSLRRGNGRFSPSRSCGCSSMTRILCPDR